MATIDETQSSLADNLMARHQALESSSTPAEETPYLNGDSPAPSEEATSPSEKTEATTAESSASYAKPAAPISKKIDINSFDAFPELGPSKAVPLANGGAWGKQPVLKPIKVSGSNSAPSGAQIIRAPAKSQVTTDKFSLALEDRDPRYATIPSSILNSVRTANNVTIDSSTTKQSKTSTFIIKGKPENVQKARRELLRALTVHVTETIRVPASSRASIIGPKGSNLKPITSKSGTQIQVAKKEDTPTPADDDEDDEPLVDVVIEGDREGVEIAKNEIMAIVNSRVRHANMKISNVPTKVYPALGGPDNSLITSMEKEKNLKITVPDHFQISKNGLQLPIVISGERSAVIEAKARLESIAQNILTTFGTKVIRVPKAVQLFISPADVFEKTGVVATTTIDPESWELFGPQNKLNEATDYLSTSGKGIKKVELTISKAHGNNVSHAKVLARYFKASGKFAELEKTHSVIISSPSEAELLNPSLSNVTLEIVGSEDANISDCRKAIVSLVNATTVNKVLPINDIDPFFFKTLTPKSKHFTTIKSEYYVYLLAPEDEKLSSEIDLIYEGNPSDVEDDFGPSSDDISNALKSASKSLDDIRSHQKDLSCEILTIPVDDHKFILGPNGTTLNSILKGADASKETLVTVHLGNEDVPQNLVKDSSELTPESVIVKGLSKQVHRVVKEIKEVIEEGHNYEVLSSYTTNFSFPAEHVNKLIGKGGANLTKIREEFGVKIDVGEDGEGIIKGIKRNAEEAKQRIFNLGRRWADEVSLKLNIPNEYHATLIGTGGKFVKRLEEKYDVRIKFPRGNSSDDDEPKDKPGQDEVLIRGPSRGAAKAKEEILELVQYEKDNSNTDTIFVPAKTLSRIIGKNGEYINDIKDFTNTRIDVGSHDDKDNGDSKVPITIVGTKTGIKQAAEKIMAIVKEIEDTVTEEIEVDPKYHRYIIGANGATMREIVQKAGEIFSSRLIQIPQAGSNSSTIKVHGHKKAVSKIINSIKAIVEERENQVEILVPIPVERHGTIIGLGGQIKKEIESEFNVNILIPFQGSKDANGKLDENIKIIGSKENVEKAKAKVVALAADDFKVNVPIEYNNSVFDGGMMIKNLRNDYGVRVDLGKTVFDKDPFSKIPAEAIGDESVDGKFKWTVVNEVTGDPPKINGATVKDEFITWKLKGSAEPCKKAKKVIEDTLERVKKYDSTGYLWLADPSQYRLVIGPSGSNINNIREKSSCVIAIPKANAKKEANAIVIIGESSNVEKAKNLILSSINR